VDDIGPVLPNQPPEHPIGEPIRRGAHGADEFRKHFDPYTRALREIEEVAFRTFGRAGREHDVMAMPVRQTFYREKRVLLSTS
jgi:hypothetical protein